MLKTSEIREAFALAFRTSSGHLCQPGVADQANRETLTVLGKLKDRGVRTTQQNTVLLEWREPKRKRRKSDHEQHHETVTDELGGCSAEER